MATNTNYYELPIPQSTDYVAAGYQAIADLGSSLDAMLSQNPLGGFRNRLINGTFDIWQRGTSFSLGASAYTSDRWLVSMSGGTTNVSRSALSTTDPVTMGAPGSTRFAIEAQNLGQSAASHFVALQQRIENVGTLAGGTVTVSFHARSGSGSPKVGVSLDQFFGTGGSPSSSVLGNGQSVTINPVWTRYSLTFSVANLFGKTIGNDGNDWLGLNLWLSAGSDFATRANSIGTQTSQIFITGVQVEGGSKTTPLEVRPLQVELSLCQRYFESSYELGTALGTVIVANAVQSRFVSVTGFSSASGHFAVTKRVRPTMRLYSTNSGAIDRIFVVGFGDTVFGADIGTNRIRAGVGTVTTTGIEYHYTADAEL